MTSQDKKDKIIRRALEISPQHGWSSLTLAQAAQDVGFDALMAEALFPSLKDATTYVSRYFDGLLMAQLEGKKDSPARTRDKIAMAVMTRLDLMAPFRDGIKSIGIRPRNARSLWITADHIWVWAGDTATDYNRYTKRALLSGVILSTTLFWLNDNSPGFRATSTFLDRRIDNIMNTGKMIGMAKQFLSRKSA